MATPASQLGIPAKHVVGARRTAEKRKEEACEPNRGGFLPFQSEHGGIELGAGEEGEDDGAKPGQKFDPGFVGAEDRRTDSGAADELGDRADDDLR